MDFLYAYLARFDWSLIWLVEYSDIFKVGLIVIGFLSGVALTFKTLIILFLENDKATVNRLLRGGAIALAIFFLLIHATVAYLTGTWYLSFQTLFSWLVALWALLRVTTTLMDVPDITVHPGDRGFPDSCLRDWDHR